MTPLFAFTVHGQPIPKGRGRTVAYRRGKDGSRVPLPFARTFTPGRTVAFEEQVAVAAREAAAEWIANGPLDQPLACRIRFYFATPKKKVTFMDRRPDVENLAKAVFDGMERGGVVKDDARFVELACSKHYDVTPRTRVEVGAPDGI